MSKKGIEVAVKKLEEYYAQFPDWYWKYGLHDAIILSACELELEPDWKERHPKRNCLEILLDSKNSPLCKSVKFNIAKKSSKGLTDWSSLFAAVPRIIPSACVKLGPISWCSIRPQF